MLREEEYEIGPLEAKEIAYETVALLAEWGEMAIKSGPPPSSALSPISVLIGKTQPRVYTKHFSLPFGAGTAGDGKSNGPGIRFVVASLTAASIVGPNGKPYSEETVRTYWQSVRKGNRRGLRKK